MKNLKEILESCKADIENQTDLILASYRYWFDEDLVSFQGSGVEALFEAPFVVASADSSEDPILNYGNRCALNLWEVEWEEFVQMPGRKTAEPMERKAREAFLKEVHENGFVKNYSGIRISKTGKRFEIKNAVVWNLTRPDGSYAGQAAMFRDWKYI